MAGNVSLSPMLVDLTWVMLLLTRFNKKESSRLIPFMNHSLPEARIWHLLFRHNEDVSNPWLLLQVNKTKQRRCFPCIYIMDYIRDNFLRKGGTLIPIFVPVPRSRKTRGSPRILASTTQKLSLSIMNRNYIRRVVFKKCYPSVKEKGIV